MAMKTSHSRMERSERCHRRMRRLDHTSSRGSGAAWKRQEISSCWCSEVAARACVARVLRGCNGEVRGQGLGLERQGFERTLSGDLLVWVRCRRGTSLRGALAGGLHWEGAA